MKNQSNTGTSGIRKAMREYRQFIINEYDKEDLVSEDLEKAAKHYLYSNILYDDVYVGNPTDKDCIEMFKAGTKWQAEQINEALLSEVLPCFMHGGEADEVVAKLDEVLNQKK